MKPERRTVAIPTHPYGLATMVEREVEADIYAGYVAVHPTLWGPPAAPVKGKQGWPNWSATFLPEGVLVGAFKYQRTAKAFALAVAQLEPQGLGIDLQVLVDLVRHYQGEE